MWNYLVNKRGNNSWDMQGITLFVSTAHKFDEDPGMVYANRKVVRAIYETEAESLSDKEISEHPDAKYKTGAVTYDGDLAAKLNKKTREMAILKDTRLEKFKELMEEKTEG